MNKYLLLFSVLSILFFSCRKDYKKAFEVTRQIEINRTITVNAGSNDTIKKRGYYLDVYEDLIEPDIATSPYRTYIDYNLKNIKISSVFLDRNMQSGGLEELDRFLFYVNDEEIVNDSINKMGGYFPLSSNFYPDGKDITSLISNDYDILEYSFMVTRNDFTPYTSYVSAKFTLEYTVSGTYWTEE